MESKALTKIALPLALAQLFHTGMGAIDTYFISAMGAAQLAGAGLAIQTFVLLSVFMGGLLSIVGVQRAYFEGKGDREGAGHTIISGFFFAFLLALFFGLMLFLFPFLLEFSNQPPEAIKIAKLYVIPLMFCTIPNLFWVTTRFIYSAEMRTFYLIWTNLAGFTAKYLGNFFLSPIYGLEGIAWSSVAAYWLMAILAIAFLWPSFNYKAPDWAQIKRMLFIGFPVSCAGICDTGFFTVIGLVIGSLGVAALSMHYIALQFLYLPYIIPYSFNVAASVRVAYYIGKNERTKITSVVNSSLLLGVIPVLVISCYYMLFKSQAIPLLWYVGIFQIFNATQVILMGALRGMQDTKVPLYLAFVSYWLVGLPLCIFLSKNFELQGIWSGMIVMQVVTTLLLKLRLNYEVRGVVLFPHTL